MKASKNIQINAQRNTSFGLIIIMTISLLLGAGIAMALEPDLVIAGLKMLGPVLLILGFGLGIIAFEVELIAIITMIIVLVCFGFVFEQASDTAIETFVTMNSEGSNIIASVFGACLLYTSPSPRDRTRSRMPSSA